MMTRVKVGSNEYAAALGKFYTQTPKAVFAALAYSYASVFGTCAEGQDETSETREIIARLTREWDVLHANGIIPQKSPSGAETPALRLTVKDTGETVPVIAIDGEALTVTVSQDGTISTHPFEFFREYSA